MYRIEKIRQQAEEAGLKAGSKLTKTARTKVICDGGGTRTETRKESVTVVELCKNFFIVEDKNGIKECFAYPYLLKGYDGTTLRMKRRK